MTWRPLTFTLLLSACLPEFDARSSIIDTERVIAVVAEPPEARPGARVRYTALAVGPEGRARTPRLLWTHCSAPKHSVENGAVAPACFEELGEPLEQQSGGTALGELPQGGCARFGPDPPPGDARPRDPDATGGFYQPVIVRTPEESAVHLERIVCNPRSAPADVAREFAASYVPNRNPSPPDLRLRAESSAEDADRVRTGDSVELTLEWAPEDAESFVWLDPETSALAPRRESLLVSWFATGGAFTTDRDAIGEDDESTSRSNQWAAPERAGEVVFWVVLRDSRGGTAFVERLLDVE